VSEDHTYICTCPSHEHYCARHVDEMYRLVGLNRGLHARVAELESELAVAVSQAEVRRLRVEALLREARDELRRIDPERKRPIFEPAEFTDEEWAVIEKEIDNYPKTTEEWAEKASMAKLMERVRPEAVARRIDAALGQVQ
jgi:hypothetical protein